MFVLFVVILHPKTYSLSDYEKESFINCIASQKCYLLTVTNFISAKVTIVVTREYARPYAKCYRYQLTNISLIASLSFAEKTVKGT